MSSRKKQRSAFETPDFISLSDSLEHAAKTKEDGSDEIDVEMETEHAKEEATPQDESAHRHKKKKRRSQDLPEGVEGHAEVDLESRSQEEEEGEDEPHDGDTNYFELTSHRNKATIQKNSRKSMLMKPLIVHFANKSRVLPQATSKDLLVSKYHVSKKRKQHLLKQDELEEERDEECVYGEESALGRREQKTLNLLASGCLKYPSVDDAQAKKCLFAPVEPHRPSNIVVDVGGHQYAGENSLGDGTRYMLAVWHKNKKEIRLTSFADVFPRLSWKSSIFQPAKPGSPSRTSTPDSDDPLEATPEPAARGKKGAAMTVSDFQSAQKKKRRTIKKEEADKGTETAAMAVPAGLLDFGEEASAEDVEQMLTKPENADLNLSIGEEMRPPGLNVDATDASELYDWPSFDRSFDEVLEGYRPMAKQLLDNGKTLLKVAKGTPRWTVFFTHELKREMRRVPEKDEEEAQLIRRVATLLFVEQILTMLIDVKHAMFPNEMFREGTPPVAVEYCLENFTQAPQFMPKKRMIPDDLKNKLVAHMLLLLIYLEKFLPVDLTKFMMLINGAKQSFRVHNMAKVIGAKLVERKSKDEVQYTLSLTYPWNFPRVPTGNTPKKRSRRN
ncbi:hypothetical protein RvY_18920 [Ramazzottius varieornatus]|uniref:Uncharacterized protein n=1 Tax=Ramazzottius varieornatus TaxID=947166 RepID=A0A1D1WA92_RAMVA|nr:hypothetical protein RvY_18920 [Ramazzottius varieornatus]